MMKKENREKDEECFYPPKEGIPSEPSPTTARDDLPSPNTIQDALLMIEAALAILEDMNEEEVISLDDERDDTW